MKQAFLFISFFALSVILLNCSGTEKKSDAKQTDSKLPVLALIDSASYDFGTIKEGEVVEHAFRFRNDGEYPLILNNITSSCGCTTPEWPKEPISPKATASSFACRSEVSPKSGDEGDMIPLG